MPVIVLVKSDPPLANTAPASNVILPFVRLPPAGYAISLKYPLLVTVLARINVVSSVLLKLTIAFPESSFVISIVFAFSVTKNSDVGRSRPPSASRTELNRIVLVSSVSNLAGLPVADTTPVPRFLVEIDLELLLLETDIKDDPPEPDIIWLHLLKNLINRFYSR
jgi:hypothetical protein